MRPGLAEKFKDLGFSEKEIMLYGACLQREEQSPTDLIRKTGLKRATAYAQLETLKEKGLIEFRVRGARRRVVALEPRVGLVQYARARQERLAWEKSTIANLISQLEKSSASPADRPRVYHYWGREGLDIAAAKILGARRNIYWLGNFEALLSLVGEKKLYRAFTLKRLPQKTVSHAITDRRILKHKQFSELIGNQRQFRFFDANVEIPGILVIYGENVCLITKHAADAHVVIIEDSIVAELASFLFSNLWQRL